jgi:hypothetical protein
VNWSTLYFSNSAIAALNKVGHKPFSKVQALVAILDWFAAQPLHLRVELVHKYLHSQAELDPAPTLPGGE